MLGKILAVASWVILPLSVAMWHRSHNHPVQYRYDVTLYKSLWVYLKDGVCGMELLSMPTKQASRSEFRNPLQFDRTQGSLLLRSVRHGQYRTTWIVFPFWLLTALLAVLGAVPVFRGPVRQVWRRWRGYCVTCGYNLTGNRSGRCPECGEHIHSSDFARRPSRSVIR